MTQPPYPQQQPPTGQQWGPPPGQQYPSAPYGPPRPPKQGMGAGAIVAIVLGSIFAFIVLIGIIGAVAGGADTDSKSDSKAAPSSAASEPAAKPASKPTTEAPVAEAPKEQSKADQFKAFVAKNGTDAEKAAVKHVIKVQGADEANNILDTADVYTDFTGGFMSKDANKAKLIASAFADWKHSKNGLVTIYGSDGDLISNGKY